MSKAVKAVGRAVSGVVKGVVKAVGSVVKAVVNVVADVINFVAQPFMGLLGGPPDVPGAGEEAAKQQGVLLQRQGSNVNIPVIYGYRKVGGIVTFAETGSTNNRYLWVAYVFSEGPVEGLREVFIDDNQLDINYVADLNAGSVVNITNGRFKDRVQLQFFNGVYFDNPTANTTGTQSICREAPSWKNSMTYNGLAVLFARFEWKEIKTQDDADNNPFGGNIPQVQVSVLGRKVASLVVSNPESYTYADAPVRYSTNPAEIVLDYLRNPRYGKGLVNDDIDWESFRRAAAKCNQIVTYVNGINGNILTCNYVLDTGSTIFANVKTLLMGFRAYMPYIQGKYKLKIEDAGNDTDILSGVATIVATFNKDNIQGNVTYTGIEKSAKYNQVAVTYVDPDQKWSNQTVVFPEGETDRQIYIQQDGGRENKLDATFPTITNYAIAKDMARLLFNKSRFQESCSLTVTSQAMELEPGDNIYIQSNLLNFTTTPWRIVSCALNDNMSYDLGCVRNPDTIYPHTRYNEEDVVLPVYVPRGATIYYPNVPGVRPVGLVPPTNAVVPGSGTTNPTYNPAPTTPGDPVVLPSNSITISINCPAVFTTSIAHGFIGNGRERVRLSTGGSLPSGVNTTTDYYVLSEGLTSTTFRVSTTPGGTVVCTSGTQNGIHTYVATITTGEVTQPVQPPVTQIGTLDTVIKIDRVDFEVVNNSVRATITFNQPDQSNFAGVDFWYKRNISTDTVFLTTRSTSRPGPGQPIQHKFENLYKSSVPYILVCRVFFTTGESSTFTTRVSLNVSGAVSTENPTEFFEGVTAGWNLNTTPPPNPRDTIFTVGNEAISGVTVFESVGVPANPRSIAITFKQDINNRAINREVDGINIFYKLSSDTKWTKTTYLLDDTYLPGTFTTFTFPGDLGLRTYPSSDDATDNYDFIFRFRYRDQTESTYQYRLMGADIERTTTANVFGSSLPLQELVSNYAFTLVDPNTVADARNITITLYENFAFRDTDGVNKMTFRFTPPPLANQSSFWGLRLFYRKVTPNSAPTFHQTDLTTINKVGSGDWRVSLPVDFDVEYQFIAVPLVRYPSGLSKTIARSGWIGQGFVHNRTTAANYPSTGNWFASLGMKTVSSSEIVGIEGTPFAQVEPFVFVKNWRKIVRGTTNNTANNVYFELEFDAAHINNYNRLVVYRRYANSTISGQARTRYWGIGRFERLEVVVGTNATLLSNGNILVNLRAPTSHQEFNASYPPTGSPPSVAESQTFIQGAINNGTNVWGSQCDQYCEFYLVARSGTTPTESAIAVKLPGITNNLIVGSYGTVNTASNVTVADYNTTISGWQRRISENRNSLANANYRPNGGTYTPPAVLRGGAIV